MSIVNKDTEVKLTNVSHISLDKETLQSYLPKGSSARLSDELMEKLNKVEQDTGIEQDMFNEQLCSYSHLITGGASVEKLANAIKFVNLRNLPKMGNAKAYRIVFPEKTKEIEGRGQSVDSFASMYNGSKLVVEVQKLMIMPVHITYAPVFHAMVKKLFNLTNGIGARETDYVSPTVQMNSAVELMKITAQPEDNSMELKIGYTDEAKNFQQSMMTQMADMAAKQHARLQNGDTVKDVQKIGVSIVQEDEYIEAEVS